MSAYSLESDHFLHGNNTSRVFKYQCVGDGTVKEQRGLVMGCVVGGRCLDLPFKSISSTTVCTARPLCIVNVEAGLSLSPGLDRCEAP